MSLHDRLKGSNGHAAAESLDEAPIVRAEERSRIEVAHERSVDPYAELKTRVHHACIAKLGPELFGARTGEDLSERVLRAVTEQLALDRTPLTRDERRQIVREISDDVLGQGGPLPRRVRAGEAERPHLRRYGHR